MENCLDWIFTNKYLYAFLGTLKDLSYTIIGIAFKVHSKLGCGLPEHCYQHALEAEFTVSRIPFLSQKRHDVHYNGEYVGHFFTDLIIDNKIILELKSNDHISVNHESQLFTYLHASGLKVGYVICFGARSLKFKRLIL